MYLYGKICRGLGVCVSPEVFKQVLTRRQRHYSSKGGLLTDPDLTPAQTDYHLPHHLTSPLSKSPRLMSTDQ